MPPKTHSSFSIRIVCHHLSLILAIFLLTLPATAQQTSLSEDDVEVSYIYAAVLGTGTYQIKGRRITMLRLPFRWSLHDDDDSSGWKVLLPVVAGYDDLSNIDSDIIDALLPDQLVTLTFLPGVEYQFTLGEKWSIKPFAQAGVGRDFNLNETILMTQLGIRTLYLTEWNDTWQFRWGNSLRWAGEQQSNSGDRLSLSIFETGVDLRHPLPLTILDRATDLGFYYIFQRLIPEWNAANTPDYRAETTSLHEFGISAGLRSPYKVLGIDVQRIRLGYKNGGSFEGWTIGTEFPF